MTSSKLVRLAGLVTMVGNFVFALGLLLRYSLGGTLAEAVTLPMYFLLVVAASVAIVATAVLLQGTPRSGLGGLAGALPWSAWCWSLRTSSWAFQNCSSFR